MRKTCEVDNCKRPVFTHGYCIMHKDRYYSGKEREPNVIPVAEYRQMRLKHFRKKKKYHNKPGNVDGKWFQSKLEANFYEELLWRQKLGEVKEIITQYKIPLNVNGQHICNYYVDFKVINSDGSISFYETKGFATDTFRLKWLLCMALREQIEPGASWEIIKK